MRGLNVPKTGVSSLRLRTSQVYSCAALLTDMSSVHGLLGLRRAFRMTVPTQASYHSFSKFQNETAVTPKVQAVHFLRAPIQQFWLLFFRRTYTRRAYSLPLKESRGKHLIIISFHAFYRVLQRFCYAFYSQYVNALQREVQYYSLIVCQMQQICYL